MRFFWHDGRFAWRFVFLVTITAISFFAFDLLWRVSKLPAAQIAGGLAITALVSVLLVLLAGRRGRR
jgi:uncharacterized membrane protein AbrB (regulator of aidB expression)